MIMAENQIKLAVVSTDIKFIKQELISLRNSLSDETHELKAMLDKSFVRREEWEPFKKLVYLIVTTILIIVITAVVKLVLIP